MTRRTQASGTATGTVMAARPVRNHNPTTDPPPKSRQAGVGHESCLPPQPMAPSPQDHPLPRNAPVTLILASRPNVYSSSPLDRIATRREDPAWIAEKLATRTRLFVPVWRDQKPRPRHRRRQPGSRLYLRRDGPRAAHPGRTLGVPRHPRRPRCVRHRHQRHRRPGPVAAGIARHLRRPALRRLGRAAARGLGAGPCARPDALAPAAQFLRRLRQRRARSKAPAT